MAGFGRLVRSSVIAPACWVALHSAPAFAQASASDKASAEALFDQGVRLMKQNSFSDACPKLEESNRIDPGVGTLLYLGECYERTGKTASAWATFREAASLASNSGQSDRARTAAARAQDLEPRLSRLSVELSPEVAHIPDVLVRRGNQRLDPSLYGTPLPVDPGEYRIEVTAPGYEPWSTPIIVAGGGASASVRVPALVKSPSGAAATPASTQNDAQQKQAAAEKDQGPSKSPGLSTQQTMGLVAGGIGLVGVGLGTYFGVRAISRNGDAEQLCPDPGPCDDAAGVSLSDKAKEDATASNIAFIAGGVLVATGAVLYLTGGKKNADRVTLMPVFGPRSAAASLSGRF